MLVHLLCALTVENSIGPHIYICANYCQIVCIDKYLFWANCAMPKSNYAVNNTKSINHKATEVTMIYQ
jgi:hypothetical protein